MAITTLQAPLDPRQDDETDRISDVESKAAAKVHKVAGTTEARIAEDDAKSARRLRERQSKVELKRQEAELKREQTEAKATAKHARKNAAAERRQARRRARAARFAKAVTRVQVFIAGNAPAVYSSCIYAMSLYVAISGQISMALDRGWPLVVGIGMAVFLEGLALSMALTAHQLRLRNERALVPAALTWVAAGFASGINVFAHREDPVMAAVLGASSLAAIIVWEVRSGAKHRAVLRAKGWLPDPPERFGLRRWVRFPRSTWHAWSLDVRDRVSVGAAALLARVETAAQDTAAASSAELAFVAKAAATEAADRAARESDRARALPRPRFQLFKRAEKQDEIEAVEAAPVKPAAPKPQQRPAKKPLAAIEASKPDVSAGGENPFTAVEDAFIDLYVQTGKRPGVRALEKAVEGAKKRSAIHVWMQRNPVLMDELSVRAEARRSGQANSGEASA
jgi:hypothetical protein